VNELKILLNLFSWIKIPWKIKATYKAETDPSGVHVTILQLQGSTELLSQFSRTLRGSMRSFFIAIKATTVQSSRENKNEKYYLCVKKQINEIKGNTGTLKPELYLAKTQMNVVNEIQKMENVGS